MQIEFPNTQIGTTRLRAILLYKYKKEAEGYQNHRAITATHAREVRTSDRPDDFSTNSSF